MTTPALLRVTFKCSIVNAPLHRTFLGLAVLFDLTTAGAQCDFDVCGYWYSENYNSGVPVEFMSVDMVGELMVCTKVLGDAYVPTGHVTWQGVPTSCTFGGQVFGTMGIGMPIVALNAQISIISADHIEVSGIGTLVFYRTNTGYMTSVGVDYSMFPVSCLACGSPIPNVFSPNGDGVNDLLEPICGARSSLFCIRDRWGKVVYEVQDVQPSWDGRDGFDPCAEGVYFWSMIAADDRTGPIRHGVVQLLR
jgi:gliding motility-associated-like protein